MPATTGTYLIEVSIVHGLGGMLDKVGEEISQTVRPESRTDGSCQGAPSTGSFFHGDAALEATQDRRSDYTEGGGSGGKHGLVN